MTQKELEYRYGCRDAPMTEEKYDELKKHKCYGCPFGKFIRTGYFCMFTTCEKSNLLPTCEKLAKLPIYEEEADKDKR